MTDRPQTTANSMWGGRFAAGPDGKYNQQILNFLTLAAPPA